MTSLQILYLCFSLLQSCMQSTIISMGEHMGALPSQKYDYVLEEFLKYLYEEYGMGFKDEKARRMIAIEFLMKCDNKTIDLR